MSKYATKEQLISIVQDMASKISVPTIGIGGGYAPIGTVISYMGVTAPQDYLACDGSTYNISAYSDLADFFESQFGSKNYFGGDGVTTFGVPTLTGAPTNAIYCIKAKAIGYSTDEQIIGSWIDGKPLYQKTLSFTTASTVGANKYGDFYGCTIVNISGGVIDGFDCFIPVNWYYDANNYFSVFGNPSNTHEGITVKTIRQSECDRPARITVRYTKTTD